MNNIKRQLFLAGGGNKSDSRVIDQLFSLALDKGKSLVYIPNAMESRPYSECLKWLESVFRLLGIDRFVMITDLKTVNLDDSLVGGIYIGGGNTIKLLREVVQLHFDSWLKKLFAQGVPIYGGSAGAIILGQTILTAPEAEKLSEKESHGLDLIDGFSAYCHYDGQRNLQSLCGKLKTKLVAIPEKAGVYISDQVLSAVGTEPISIFTDSKRLCLKPEEKLNLKVSKIEKLRPLKL